MNSFPGKNLSPIAACGFASGARSSPPDAKPQAAITRIRQRDTPPSDRFLIFHDERADFTNG
ncbi:MAG TPA: hypothetical protein VLJ39_22680, partial [Tepidisphaeraceae bacterium]|nr:hypothetical protein [Tepidisphaeraceae bacterium]